MAEENQENQERLQIKEMARTKGWELLLQHLERQCKQRRVEASNALRAGNFNFALRLQGELDGVESVLKVVDTLSSRKMEEEEKTPSY